AAQPGAQAMAIDSATGYLLAVGSNDEVRRYGSLHTELVDLRGRTVLPVSLTPTFTFSARPIAPTISTPEPVPVKMTWQSWYANALHRLRQVSGYLAASGTRTNGPIKTFQAKPRLMPPPPIIL